MGRRSDLQKVFAMPVLSLATVRMASLALLSLCFSEGICFGDVFYNFSNSTRMRLPATGSGGEGVGMADPYPSAIDVSGVQGRLVNIQISLHGLSHTYPNDLGAVVVAPSGTAAILFSGPGSNIRAVDLDFVFDDNAAETLPSVGALSSGTFKPGLEEWDDYFPEPGPGKKPEGSDTPPWNFEFRPWLSEDPNGRWDLFVIDAQSLDIGEIAEGWSITFQAVPEPGLFPLGLSLLVPMAHRRQRRSSLTR